MRDPAIHIRKSDLYKILVDYGVNHRDMDAIMLSSRKFNIKNRVNVIMPAKARQKAQKVVSSQGEHIEEFNQIYDAILKENSIKTLSIHKGDTNYQTLVSVSDQVKEFCTLFGLEYREGAIIYMRTGVKILGRNYSLYRLKGASERIVTKYRVIDTLNGDDNPLGTGIMRQAWVDAVKKYFHTNVDIKNDPEKLSHIVLARKDADSMGADYNDWINAQFEKWLYTSDIPAFSQLHGDNAMLNYKIYANKQGTSTKEVKYLKSLKDGKEEVPIKKAVAIRGQSEG